MEHLAEYAEEKPVSPNPASEVAAFLLHRIIFRHGASKFRYPIARAASRPPLRKAFSNFTAVFLKPPLRTIPKQTAC